MDYQDLTKGVIDGRLTLRRLGEDYEIFCYTKDVFFDFDWDETTKKARGLVTYKGKIVNHPFPKIFNLNEVEEVSHANIQKLIDDGEEYRLYHKVNGHLAIVSYIAETGDLLVHTKGSLDSEMIDKDKEILAQDEYANGLVQWMRARFPNTSFTLCFESLTPSDKHTMYDEDCQTYEIEEGFVLLGGYYMTGDGWVPMLSDMLDTFQWLGYRVAMSFDDVDLSKPENVLQLFTDECTEGYVIWFDKLDLRVKIKTTEYWKLRFMKDLSPENVLAKYLAAGMDRLKNRYPEEVADIFTSMIEHNIIGYVGDIKMGVENIIETHDIQVADRETIDAVMTPIQKMVAYKFCFGGAEIKDHVDGLSRSKLFRNEFVCSMLDENRIIFNAHHKECIDKIQKNV